MVAVDVDRARHDHAVWIVASDDDRHDHARADDDGGRDLRGSWLSRESGSDKRRHQNESH